MNLTSVVTIVHNRKNALQHLILGLINGKVMPDELVVIHINEDSYILPPAPFPTLQVSLKSKSKLPLAHARNMAVDKANFDNIIFLDVDCIPGKELVANYIEAIAISDALLVGKVGYLPHTAMKNPGLMDQLPQLAIADKIRSNGKEISYELFWSLNFGCTRKTFDKIGGFDYSYDGYGAEDTDFSFTAKSKNVPIQWVNATAYHQPHASYDPPVNHLQDIVSNANRFKAKWGIWPMEGWLKRFKAMGLVDWQEDLLHLKRLPSEDELSNCLKAY